MWKVPATLVAMSLTVVFAVAQPTPKSNAPNSIFWDVVDQIGLIFKSIGSLSGGVDRGQIWIVELQNGQRHAVSDASDLSWPVQAADGTVYALHDGRLIRLSSRGSEAAMIGQVETWRKLLGVNQDGVILGLVAGHPRVQPALMDASGSLTLVPQPETTTDRERISVLLQENRAYTDDRWLVVKRSERGEHGFDVFLVVGQAERNLTDCGDDACGQPSLTPNGLQVLYVRAPK